MLSRKNKVIHVTSAHARYDTRIFIKMCSSLAKHDYQVSLIVADGLGDELKNNVSIYDVGAKAGGRLGRMTKTVNKVFQKAKELDGDIYHLHDPELILEGLKLKKNKKKVIFDAHEDLPKQILGKPYLNNVSRFILSKILMWFERWACQKFDVIIAATPHIRDKFIKINPYTVDINNFPLLEELSNICNWEQKEDEVAYVGGIAKIRGVEEIVDALRFIKGVRLNLAGEFSETTLEAKVKSHPAWSKVNELGFLNRNEVNNVLARSKAGLVTLHPVINYLDALPVKMFEYMAAGIPVISSSFPLWKEIVEESSSGICVDPLDAKEIAKAIKFILSNPKKAKLMGENGQRAVLEKYNWKIEEQKLMKIYEGLKA